MFNAENRQMEKGLFICWETVNLLKDSIENSFTQLHQLTVAGLVEWRHVIATLIFKVKILVQTRTNIGREKIVISSYIALSSTITMSFQITCNINTTAKVFIMWTTIFPFTQSTVRRSFYNHVLTFGTVSICYLLSKTRDWTWNTLKALVPMKSPIFIFKFKMRKAFIWINANTLVICNI